ncbi:BEL1-like homeodomain protein 1 [Elaeis guineensis]|uniref:BEL1-like homeodomain protein 1 n=1 Tax=Elaeis guineensis var. tenera TaxID=51953 RepID=A0A6I9RR68_ELAGV|nr:BEL1-like homeodomain protein 1 [Elaeis guineensis]XP_010931061.1 BEL1-like homeodomain protein 1 [Elaeis guineensis]
MATYFHGAPAEFQADGLQTLYLMNPNYAAYSDTAVPANMILLNSVNSLNPTNLGHCAATAQPNQHQHFAGIPLQPPVAAHESNRLPSIQPSHDVSADPRLHYNLWTPTAPNNSIDMASQLGPRRTSTAPPQPQQGLSLSLSPQEITLAGTEEAKILGSSSSAPSGVSNAVSVLQSFLIGSKYLKAAQQLLDEAVHVGQGIKGDSMKGTNSKSPTKSNRESEGTGTGTAEEDKSTKREADLTTAERQELQMKKAKLVNMLEEVEQRYRQYHHQMQIVVSSFEQVAGIGSARTYTALALQTISKQFRCLRDAITGQIQATSRSLGEEDTKSGGSRLRLVDHHLRQQRALQQLGMIQHNAWRPQRGLPERSVSVLRAWLFEHFLHPYPKDSDKLMLAKQTGLTRSQVSNWFINARVRLWKPMVEEMYLEEMKDHEPNYTDEKGSKSDANENSISKSSANQESSPTRTGQDYSNDPKPSTVAIPLPSLGNDQKHAAMQQDLKKARSEELLQPNTMTHSISFDMKSEEMSNRELLMKFMDGRQRAGDQGFSLIAGNTSHGGNFEAYPVAGIGRFDSEQFAPSFSGNGVSLTLGLPQCENFSLSGAQPSFLTSRVERGLQHDYYQTL